MRYYPVSFEKDGNEFVAVKMKGGFESDDENEVYEWILDYDSKQFDFEKFSKMPIEELIENKPVNYYVFSDDSVGYAVIERHDCGEDKVDFYENEELIVLNNFYDKQTTVSIDNIEEYEVMISNYQDHDLKKELHIRPYETVALYKKK